MVQSSYPRIGILIRGSGTEFAAYQTVCSFLTTPPEKGEAWDVARPPFIVVRLGAARRKTLRAAFFAAKRLKRHKAVELQD